MVGQHLSVSGCARCGGTPKGIFPAVPASGESRVPVHSLDQMATRTNIS